MENRSIISFVVPSNVDISNIRVLIEQLDPISYSSIKYPNNCISYQYTIINKSNDIERFTMIKSINEMIDDVSMKQFTYHCPLGGEIFKYFIRDYINIKYDIKVDIQYNSTLITPMIPVNNDFIPLYLSRYECDELKGELDSYCKKNNSLSIGKDPLVVYILEQDPDYIALKNNLTKIDHKHNSQYLITLDESINITNIIDTVEDIHSQIISYHNEGYFAYINNGDNNVKNDILIELWNNEVVKRYEDGITIAKQRNIENIPYRPDILMKNVFLSTFNFTLPKIQFGGPWQNLLPYNDIKSSVKLIYQATIIAKDIEYTKYCLDEITVNYDKTLIVPLTSYYDFRHLHSELIRNCDNMKQYHVQNVDNIEDAFVLRSIIYDKYKEKSLCIVLKDKIYIIAPININFDIDINDRDREDVKRRLIEYFQKESGSDSDLISAVRYDEMDISELIKVIKPESDSDHCTSILNLKRYGKDESMVTKRQLSNNVIRMIHKPYIALYGYTNCAYLPGLFDEVPCKEDIKLDLSMIDIKIADNKMFANGDVIITDDRLYAEKYREKITNMWYSGRLLPIYDHYIINRFGYQIGYNIIIDGNLNIN